LILISKKLIRERTRPSTPENVQAADDDYNMYVYFVFIYIISNLIIGCRDPTTPERFRSGAQRNERDQRVLESPEHRRIPHHVQIAQSGVSAPPIHPPIFMPPAIVPPPAPVYQNLPSHLAQQYADLPDLYPRRQASVAPPPVPQLAPAFVPVPGPGPYRNRPANLAQRLAALPPAPVPQLAPAFLPTPGPGQYQNLPAHLAQQLAALPPLIQRGRGRGRGRGYNAIVVAPLPYAEIAAQYAALPPVCVMFYLFS
jgi:hypothetical protein